MSDFDPEAEQLLILPPHHSTISAPPPPPPTFVSLPASTALRDESASPLSAGDVPNSVVFESDNGCRPPISYAEASPVNPRTIATTDAASPGLVDDVPVTATAAASAAADSVASPPPFSTGFADLDLPPLFSPSAGLEAFSPMALDDYLGGSNMGASMPAGTVGVVSGITTAPPTAPATMAEPVSGADLLFTPTNGPTRVNGGRSSSSSLESLSGSSYPFSSLFGEPSPCKRSPVMTDEGDDLLYGCPPSATAAAATGAIGLDGVKPEDSEFPYPSDSDRSKKATSAIAGKPSLLSSPSSSQSPWEGGRHHNNNLERLDEAFIQEMDPNATEVVSGVVVVAPCSEDDIKDDDARLFDDFCDGKPDVGPALDVLGCTEAWRRLKRHPQFVNCDP
jgi:hypothetical protein